MSSSNERQIVVKTTTLLKTVAVLLAMWFLWLVRDIVALLFVSLFISAMIHPAARWGAKHRIPKSVMVIMIYLGVFALAAMSFAVVIPTLIQQIGNLSESVGGAAQVISNGLQSLKSFSEHYGLANNMTAGLASLQTQVTNAATGLVGTLTDFFGGFVSLIIVLVMSFYMVVEDADAIRLFKNLMPEPYQDMSAQLVMQVETKIGRWLSGQLFLSLIIGVFYYVGLLVLGIGSPLPLSLFGAFTEVIPYLGPILGGIPILLVALASSPFKALLALGFLILIQQIESQIVVPKVMQKAVGLNPLISIIAVLIGMKLFGLVGAIIAIPIATAIGLVVTELYRFRRDRQI